MAKYSPRAVSERRAAKRTPPPLKQVRVLADAAEDLEAARDLYDTRNPALGNIVSIHYWPISRVSDFSVEFIPLHFEFHRMLASRFPFGIYYREHGDEAQVFAVLDLRRNPNWIRKELKKRDD